MSSIVDEMDCAEPESTGQWVDCVPSRRADGRSLTKGLMLGEGGGQGCVVDFVDRSTLVTLLSRQWWWHVTTVVAEYNSGGGRWRQWQKTAAAVDDDGSGGRQLRRWPTMTVVDGDGLQRQQGMADKGGWQQLLGFLIGRRRVWYLGGTEAMELIGFRFFEDSCDGRFVGFVVSTEFGCNLQLSVDVE